MKPQELVEDYPRTVTALVTPIKDGLIDEVGLQKLIQFHLAADTPAVLVCGTTGESATMSHDEHKRVIKLAVATVKAYREENPECKTQIWSGTGSNSTREAIELSEFADKAGVDVALVITPYYNKPTPRGMISHFRAVADAVKVPIVLYNVPGRTGINLGTGTVIELSKVSNIVGVKEASGNVGQISEIAAGTPDDFLLWSGDDALTLPILSVGGIGVISVTANIVPWDIEALCRAFEARDMVKALRIHRQLYDLHKAMFVETNPIPVKTAVNLLHEEYSKGVPDGVSKMAAKYYPLIPSVGGFRLPLVPLAQENMGTLRKTMRDYGLIR